MSDLPPGWEWSKLGEIAEVRLGRQRSPKNHSGTHMRPYLRAANVGWSGLKLDDVKQMNFTDEELEIYRLQTGDIVVGEASGSASEVGKSAVWNNEIADCCLQNTLIRVRTQHIDPRYLLYFIRATALRGEFVEKSRGVGIYHIGAAKLAQWPVPVPPVLEQHRIVAILEDHFSRLDASKRLVSSAKNRAHKLRDKTISDACTGKVFGTATVKAAPLADVGLDDGVIPKIPSDWKWKRLHKIAEVVGGITKDTKKQFNANLREVAYLRVANVQRGRLDTSNVTTIRTTDQKIAQLRLQIGDILINEGGDRDKLARGWIWEGQISECIHQNHVFRARVKENIVDPRIVAWHANTFGKSWAEANGKQSVNLASISLSKIRQLPIPIPPKEIQAKIIDLVESQLTAIDKIISSAASIQAKVETLRHALLYDAFSGRLTSQDSSDEPASVLLDRIRDERAKTVKPVRKKQSKAG